MLMQVTIWRSAVKWVVLWLTLSILTIINSIALVIVLENDVFALICAVMFCWSGVLGLVGATRTLLGHCLAGDHDLEGSLEGYHLKVSASGQPQAYWYPWCCQLPRQILFGHERCRLAVVCVCMFRRPCSCSLYLLCVASAVRSCIHCRCLHMSGHPTLKGPC